MQQQRMSTSYITAVPAHFTDLMHTNNTMFLFMAVNAAEYRVSLYFQQGTCSICCENCIHKNHTTESGLQSIIWEFCVRWQPAIFTGQGTLLACTTGVHSATRSQQQPEWPVLRYRMFWQHSKYLGLQAQCHNVRLTIWSSASVS